MSFMNIFQYHISITIISYRTEIVLVVDRNFLKSVPQTSLQSKFQSQLQTSNSLVGLVRVDPFLIGGKSVILVIVCDHSREYRARTFTMRVPLAVTVLLQLPIPLGLLTPVTMLMLLLVRLMAQGQLKSCNLIKTIHI